MGRPAIKMVINTERLSLGNFGKNKIIKESVVMIRQFDMDQPNWLFAEVGLGDRQSLAAEWRRIGPAAESRLTCISVTWSLEHSTPFASWWRVIETPLATRLAAVKDILDRVGFVPPKRPELSVQIDNIGQYKKRNWWRRRQPQL